MLKITNRSTGNKRIRLTALDSAMSNIDDSVGAVAKVGREVLLCLAPTIVDGEDHPLPLPQPFLTNYFLPDIHEVPGVADQGGYLNVSVDNGPVQTLAFPAGALPDQPGMTTNFMAFVTALMADGDLAVNFGNHFIQAGFNGNPPTESTPENPVGFVGLPGDQAVYPEPKKFTFHDGHGEGVNLYEHLGFTGFSFSIYSWGPVRNAGEGFEEFYEHQYYAGGQAVMLRSQTDFRVDRVNADGLQDEALGGPLTANRGLAVSPDDTFLVQYSDDTEMPVPFSVKRNDKEGIAHFELEVSLDHNGEIPKGVVSVAWSHDSQLLVVNSWESTPNNYFIYKRQPDNSFVQVFKMKRESSAYMAFTPDNAQLVLAEMGYNGESIHVVPYVFDVLETGELDTNAYALVGEFLPSDSVFRASQISSDILWVGDKVAVMSRNFGLSAITIDPVAKTVTGKNLVSPTYEFTDSLRTLLLLDGNTKLGFAARIGGSTKLGVIDFNVAELTVDLASVRYSDIDPVTGDEGNMRVHPLNDMLISINSKSQPSTLDWHLVNEDNTATKVVPAPANT